MEMAYFVAGFVAGLLATAAVFYWYFSKHQPIAWVKYAGDEYTTTSTLWQSIKGSQIRYKVGCRRCDNA